MLCILKKKWEVILLHQSSHLFIKSTRVIDTILDYVGEAFDEPLRKEEINKYTYIFLTE